MCFRFCEDDPILDEHYWEHLDEVCPPISDLVVPESEVIADGWR